MDTIVHRHGARRVTVSHFPALLTLCLAVLVAQIDTAVVNLGTHRIGSYFHASVGALQWVVDAYNLTYAVLPWVPCMRPSREAAQDCAWR